MTEDKDLQQKLGEILGEDDFPRSRQDLPPATTRRWVIRRKAQVVAGVELGIVSEAEALDYYGLSNEEYESWRRLLMEHGLKGLRATRLQDYR
ncbi:MAG: DUF1153 domain-containing protein [Alphaproteobacteria bacterium]|nr:DUF1153 domain-containing protein [Alphaproteobacteria bacterium]